jgi:hypothetical protein
LRWLALPVVVLGVAVGMTDFSPDPVDLPEPKLFFTFDKTFLSPAGSHSLALTAILAAANVKREDPRLPAFFAFSGAIRSACSAPCASPAERARMSSLRLWRTCCIDAFIVIAGVLLMFHGIGGGMARCAGALQTGRFRPPAQPAS